MDLKEDQPDHVDNVQSFVKPEELVAKDKEVNDQFETPQPPINTEAQNEEAKDE